MSACFWLCSRNHILPHADILVQNNGKPNEWRCSTWRTKIIRKEADIMNSCASLESHISTYQIKFTWSVLNIALRVCMQSDILILIFSLPAGVRYWIVAKILLSRFKLKCLLLNIRYSLVCERNLRDWDSTRCFSYELVFFIWLPW